MAFHSGYGHTAVLAEAVRRGAEKAGAEVAFVPVDAITDEQWQQLDAADAIVFGSPTYMGGAAAGFVKKHRHYDIPAAKVWDLVGDFSTVETWMPGIAALVPHPSAHTRTVTMHDGGRR